MSQQDRAHILVEISIRFLAVPMQLCQCIKIHTSEALSLPVIQTLYVSASWPSLVSVEEETVAPLSHSCTLHFKGVRYI
jgi:hypothetical protein